MQARKSQKAMRSLLRIAAEATLMFAGGDIVLDYAEYSLGMRLGDRAGQIATVKMKKEAGSPLPQPIDDPHRQGLS